MITASVMKELKKAYFLFLMAISQTDISKLFYRNLQHLLYLSLLPIMENLAQLTCIVIGLEVLEDTQIFSDIAHLQEKDNLFVNTGE